MNNILLISPEIGKDKGGIQNWMYYVESILKLQGYQINSYCYKENRFTKLFKYYNSDIFVLATWKMALFICPLLFVRKKKVFIFVHGNEILNINNILKNLLCYLLKRKKTYFIANSNAIANLFKSVTNREIDFVQYPFMEINNKDNLSKKRNSFFTLTRLVKRKNIKNVIYAFAKLKNENFDFSYTIAGDGSEKFFLMKLVEDFHLTKEIIFVGKVDEDEKEKFYAESKFFLLPSLFDESDGSIEGYGIVFIEANLYGIPVISGNTGGMIEAVIDGKTGLHCDGSIDDIYEKIKKIVKINFNMNDIKSQAKKHDYLRQKNFLTFIENKLNE